MHPHSHLSTKVELKKVLSSIKQTSTYKFICIVNLFLFLKFSQELKCVFNKNGNHGKRNWTRISIIFKNNKTKNHNVINAPTFKFEGIVLSQPTFIK